MLRVLASKSIRDITKKESRKRRTGENKNTQLLELHQSIRGTTKKESRKQRTGENKNTQLLELHQALKQQCLTQLPRADHHLRRRLPIANLTKQQCRRSYSSMLERYGRDMTAAASSSGPVFGRDDEIDRVVSILSRKSKNSAVLVGAAGVGKTAIAEGLAQRIAGGQVPDALAGARVVDINVSAMLAGCTYRGMFEERVTGMIAEAEKGAAAPGPCSLAVPTLSRRTTGRAGDEA